MDYDEPWHEYDDNPDWNSSMDDSVPDDPEWIYKWDYNGPSSVIEGLIKEWLIVTSGGVPVLGWPLEDRIMVGFKGRIPPDEHTEISKKVLEFFDGGKKACIFPVKRVVVFFVSDTTRVTVVGDRSRAQEMLPNVS